MIAVIKIPQMIALTSESNICSPWGWLNFSRSIINDEHLNVVMSQIEVEDDVKKNPTRSSYRVFGLDVILDQYDQIFYCHVVWIALSFAFGSFFDTFSDFIDLYRSFVESITLRSMHTRSRVHSPLDDVTYGLITLTSCDSRRVCRRTAFSTVVSDNPCIVTSHELGLFNIIVTIRSERDEFPSAMDHTDLLNSSEVWLDVVSLSRMCVSHGSSTT